MPGTQYDPSIPTFDEVLGHEPGERIYSHDAMMAYLDTVADALPKQIQIIDSLPAITWLACKPLVMVQEHGRGPVVGFTADPNFRASMDGMNLLFLNTVFRGPARARPAVSP